jgi:hypothetical protein
MATTQNFLGKCKQPDCDYVIFATGEDVKDTVSFNGVKAGTGVYQVGSYGRFARCTSNHKVFPVKAVKGTYSADHKCDSRCLNARGWSCTCSCGGANHGRGHVATIVNASDLPESVATKPWRQAPTVEPADRKHLGEVGQTIRGEVQIVNVRDVNDATLYTFQTLNGGHIIKWFAPSFANPDWPVGKALTIRAKVKAHNEFRGTPETVVIYVEEVE